MEPLKNMYNDQFFAKLTGAITSVYGAFDVPVFMARIYDDEWSDRELKDRMRHITVTLHDCLPADYRTALNIISPDAAPSTVRTFQSNGMRKAAARSKVPLRRSSRPPMTGR